MMIEQNYNLDLVPSGTPLVVYVSQFDTGSRRLSFTLYKDNVAFTLPTGATATLVGTKPDLLSFMYTMQTSGNKVYLDITEQITAAAGPVQCEIRVSSSSGDRIGTSNFIIYVEKTPLDTDAVISETEIPIFEELVANAQAAAAEAQDSADSVSASAAQIAANTAAIATKANIESPTLFNPVISWPLDSNDNAHTTPRVIMRASGSAVAGTMSLSLIVNMGSGNVSTDLIDSAGNVTVAPKASPALTGTPTAPTAADGTNNTQIATTAFVANALTAALSGAIADAINAATKYKNGDSYVTSAPMILSGYSGYANRNAYFTLQLPKSIEDITSIAVAQFTGAVRGTNAYLNGSTDSYDWLTGSNVTSVTATKVSNNAVRIQIVTSSGMSGAVVNTPVVFNGNITLTFAA